MREIQRMSAMHGATGWCIFNDLAVAARAAHRDAGVEKVLFVDLDVHQGEISHFVLHVRIKTETSCTTMFIITCMSSLCPST